jgi:hypothetical protein
MPTRAGLSQTGSLAAKHSIQPKNAPSLHLTDGSDPRFHLSQISTTIYPERSRRVIVWSVGGAGARAFSSCCNQRGDGTCRRYKLHAAEAVVTGISATRPADRHWRPQAASILLGPGRSNCHPGGWRRRIFYRRLSYNRASPRIPVFVPTIGPGSGGPTRDLPTRL